MSMVVLPEEMSAARPPVAMTVTSGISISSLMRLIGHFHFFLDAVDDAVDLPDEAVVDPRLHGAHRIFTDAGRHLFQLDPGQLRRPLEERFHGDADARSDRAAQILAFFIDHAEGRGRAHIDDDRRAAVLVSHGNIFPKGSGEWE